MAALCGFYSSGAATVGLPAFASQIKATWVQPPLSDLQKILGPNHDPLPRWIGHVDGISMAEHTHCQQHWWASALGKKKLLNLLDAATPRDQARLLEQAGPGLGSAFI